jgi:putative Mg2+ transporter-C (MgtC) family protein
VLYSNYAFVASHPGVVRFSNSDHVRLCFSRLQYNLLHSFLINWIPASQLLSGLPVAFRYRLLMPFQQFNAMVLGGRVESAFALIDFNPQEVLNDFVSIAIAFILALPIAWERSQRQRKIGLRTFPIVAIASCGFMLITRSLPGDGAEAQSRVIQGLLTGIGFIGGGAILKHEMQVLGLATAASIWNTAAIGAAVALGREEIALVLSVTNFITLRLLSPLVQRNYLTSEPNEDDAV